MISIPKLPSTNELAEEVGYASTGGGAHEAYKAVIKALEDLRSRYHPTDSEAKVLGEFQTAVEEARDRE